VSFAPGIACPGCGGDASPLVFRGWVRHTGYVFGSREVRGSGYLCRGCADRQVAAALAWTGLVGWWSISSFLFLAPRATFYNWLGAFRAPFDPLGWGAIALADYLDDTASGLLADNREHVLQ
jgi:hypothetical protein